MGNCQSARDLEYGDPILTVSSDANSEHKFGEWRGKLILP